MISIELIKNDTEGVKKALAKKGCNVDFSQVLNLDNERRKVIQEVESLKSQKNKVSAQIPIYKKEGKDGEEEEEEVEDEDDDFDFDDDFDDEDFDDDYDDDDE